MPARDQEQQVGEFERVVDQARAQRVALQVVDGEQRQVVDRGDGFAGHQAHHDRADQAGAGGGGHAVEGGEADAGVRHGTGDEAVEVVHMAARGDLRHDPAIGRVVRALGEHEVGQHAALAGYQRGCGLVATGLDAEDDHGPSLSRRGAAPQRSPP